MRPSIEKEAEMFPIENYIQVRATYAQFPVYTPLPRVSSRRLHLFMVYKLALQPFTFYSHHENNP